MSKSPPREQRKKPRLKRQKISEYVKKLLWFCLVVGVEKSNDLIM